MSANSSRRRLAALAGFLLFSIATTSLAQNAPQSGSWRMPNLVPTIPGGNPNRSTMSKVVDPFGILPGNGAKASNASYGQPQPPSMLQKMTSGTKRAASQTADFLNPFNDGPTQVKEESVTGSNSAFARQSNQQKSKTASSSWAPGWLGGAPPEQQKPKTVNDFLSQQRLQP
jgi:hypothetical protein